MARQHGGGSGIAVGQLGKHNRPGPGHRGKRSPQHCGQHRAPQAAARFRVCRPALTRPSANIVAIAADDQLPCAKCSATGIRNSSAFSTPSSVRWRPTRRSMKPVCMFVRPSPLMICAIPVPGDPLHRDRSHCASCRRPIDPTGGWIITANYSAGSVGRAHLHDDRPRSIPPGRAASRSTSRACG